MKRTKRIADCSPGSKRSAILEPDKQGIAATGWPTAPRQHPVLAAGTFGGVSLGPLLALDGEPQGQGTPSVLALEFQRTSPMLTTTIEARPGKPVMTGPGRRDHWMSARLGFTARAHFVLSEDIMDDPSQIDRETMSEAPDKDHARVLEMINSVDMQKRLEEARFKRARILAERAAGTGGPAASNLVPAAVPFPTDTTIAKSLETVAPASPALAEKAVASIGKSAKAAVAPREANPASTVDRAATLDTSLPAKARPAASPPVESVRRNAPVLRAPPRLGVVEPTRGASRTGPLPVERRTMQPRSVALGLIVGMIAGIGMTQVVDVAAPRPSAPGGRDPGTGRPPSITVDAVSPTAGLAGTAMAAPGRLVVPRRRPAPRGDAAPPDLPAVEPAPDRPIPIRIDDILRSSRTQALPVAPVPAAPSAAPPTAPRRGLATGVSPMKDEAPPLRAEPPAPMPVHLGARLRMVVHRPPDFSDHALADLRRTLSVAGYEPAETRTVNLRFKRNEVRYFHKEDAANAARIARAIGAEPRDFSFYRPAPSLGTVEVWLAARR